MERASLGNQLFHVVSLPTAGSMVSHFSPALHRTAHPSANSETFLVVN